MLERKGITREEAARSADVPLAIIKLMCGDYPFGVVTWLVRTVSMLKLRFEYARSQVRAEASQ